MALVFLESFSHYADGAFTSAATFGKWTSAAGSGTIASGQGPRANCKVYNAGPFADLYKYGLPPHATYVLGFRSKWYGTPYAYWQALGTNNNPHIEMLANYGGSISVKKYTGGSSSVVIGTTASGILINGTWAYIEVKVYVHATLGTVEVRVNGQTVLNLTNQNTHNSAYGLQPTTDIIGMEFHPNGLGCDLYLLNGAGTSNNDFWGDVRVDPHYPTGAGTKAEWTPSTGSNFQNVDDGSSGPDGDTTRNSSATVGQIDSFALEDLKNTGATIKGVQVLNAASKDNAGPCVVRNVLRIGGTEYEGANFYPSVGSYVYDRDVYDVSPATSSVFDEAEFNAMEVGYKRQS